MDLDVAILPLAASPELSPLLQDVCGVLAQSSGTTSLFDIDAAGLITDRIARQDELGTPICVLVDFESLRDSCVVVRDRLTQSQARVPLRNLPHAVADALHAAGRTDAASTARTEATS